MRHPVLVVDKNAQVIMGTLASESSIFLFFAVAVAISRSVPVTVRSVPVTVRSVPVTVRPVPVTVRPVPVTVRSVPVTV